MPKILNNLPIHRLNQIVLVIQILEQKTKKEGTPNLRTKLEKWWKNKTDVNAIVLNDFNYYIILLTLIKYYKQ